MTYLILLAPLLLSQDDIPSYDITWRTMRRMSCLATLAFGALYIQIHHMAMATHFGAHGGGGVLQAPTGEFPRTESYNTSYDRLHMKIAYSSLVSFWRIDQKSGYIGEAHYMAQMLGDALESAFIRIWLNTAGTECETLSEHSHNLIEHAVTGMLDGSTTYACIMLEAVATLQNDLDEALHTMIQVLMDDHCPDLEHNPNFITLLSDAVHQASVDVLIQATKSVAKCELHNFMANADTSSLQGPNVGAVKSGPTPGARAKPIGSWPGYELPLLNNTHTCYWPASLCCNGDAAKCASMNYVKVK